MKNKNFKIKSGRGYKKMYLRILEPLPNTPIKVLKVAQDQSTGAEMGLIEYGKYQPSYVIVYSSGDTASFKTKEEAEKQFNKHIKVGDLI
jgi:hypothetical protein